MDRRHGSILAEEAQMTDPFILAVLGILVACAVYCVFKKIARDFPPWLS